MAPASLPLATPLELIRAMADRIVRQFHPEMIVLFGSYARGEATQDSDVDLLVVMQVAHSRREVRRQVYRALDDRLLPLDVVIATPEQVERQRSQVGTMIYPALQEGRVLYQHQADE